jgi:O-antigen/teichoic acid export membrane protein
VIARRSLVIILNKAVGTFIGFGGLFFVFRYMDKAAYGMYAFGFALVGLFALITGMGINAAHVKRLSEGHAEGEANGTYLLLKLSLTVLFLTAIGASYIAFTRLLGQAITDATTVRVLIAMALVFTTLSIRQFFDYTFQAHRRTALGESVLFIDSLVTSIGFATAALVWRHLNGAWTPLPDYAQSWITFLNLTGPATAEDGALMLAMAYLAGTTVSLLVAAGIFLAHEYPISRPTAQSLQSYRRFARPLALVAIIATIFTYIDIVFLGYFWQKNEVADYRAAVQLLSPALIIGSATWTVLFPTISDHHARQGRAHVAGIVSLAERYISMALMGALAIGAVFARQGLHVVSSDQYLVAAPTLQILTLFVFFTALTVPGRALVMGYDLPRQQLHIGLTMTASAILLDLILVPTSILGVPLAGLGARGAALGTAAAALIGYLHTKALARRQEQLRWLPRHIERHALSALVTALALMALRDALGPSHFDRIWELAATFLIGMLLYAALLTLTRALTRDDWRLVLDLAHPGRMRTYVLSEFSRRDTQDQRLLRPKT